MQKCAAINGKHDIITGSVFGYYVMCADEPHTPEICGGSGKKKSYKVSDMITYENSFSKCGAMEYAPWSALYQNMSMDRLSQIVKSWTRTASHTENCRHIITTWTHGVSNLVYKISKPPIGTETLHRKYQRSNRHTKY